MELLDALNTVLGTPMEAVERVYTKKHIYGLIGKLNVDDFSCDFLAVRDILLSLEVCGWICSL